MSKNVAEALEQVTTRALASDASVVREYGPLTAVNLGERFSVSRRSGGKLLQKIEVDGLLAGAGAVLLNSTTHMPSLKHADKAATDAAKLHAMLDEHLASLSTKPPHVKAELDAIARLPVRVVPFLSGSGFTAAVMARCRAAGVGIVRPSEDGFVVEQAPRTS